MNERLPRVLFIMRKYPPRVGGMEQFSFHLTQKITCEKQIIAWGFSQVWLPLFAVFATIRALFLAPRYDIIHLGDLALSSVAWILKSAYPRKKIVVTVHGLDLTYPHPVYQRYLRIFSRSFDLYICNSMATLHLVHKRELSPAITIPIGVDTSAWDGERDRNQLSKFVKRATENKFVIVTTGRLVKRKGVLWFLRNVLPKLPNDVLYCIVGEGKMRSVLSQSIQRLNLGNRALLLGRVGDPDLRMIYHSADLFVMPNIVVPNDMEGFGIVALEAGASGLPVLASNIEGIKESVRDGENGWLVKAGNAEEYIRKISDLIGNHDALMEMRKRGRAYVFKYFDWEIISSQYLHEFQRLASASFS